MFSWKDNSERIFNKILTNSHSVTSYESDSDDESVSYTLPTHDTLEDRNGSSSPSSLSDEEINEKLQRWFDLTNIEMGPFGGNSKHRSSPDGKKTPDSAGSRNSALSPTMPLSEEETSETELSFKFQFLIMSERLKVTLLKASNIFPGTSSPTALTTYAKVCLMPEKAHVQTSHAVKGSSNPEFNSVMYFDGLSLQEMHQMSLRITLYGRQESDSQSVNLGEVTVCLEDFDLTAENTLNEYVNTRICSLSRGNGSYRIRLLR